MHWLLVEETCISFHWPRKNQPYKQQSQLMQKVVLVIMFYFKISLFPTHLRIHHPAFLKIKIKWRIFVWSWSDLTIDKIRNISYFNSFKLSIQASARFQKCFHLQIHKKISANLGIPHPQEKIMIKFSSNQGRLREEIFVNSRQPTLHKKNSSCQLSRQISAIIFFKSRRLVLLYENSNQGRLQEI